MGQFSPDFTVHRNSEGPTKNFETEGTSNSAPTISVIPPTGKPPCNSSSTARMPVGKASRMIRGAGERADGIRSAKAASILARKEGSGEHSISPYIRLYGAIFQMELPYF
jgi:hypothetical protein